MSRSIVREIDEFIKDTGSRHNLHNLPLKDYSVDVVARWIRRYWSELQRVHDSGEGDSFDWENSLHLIFIDLSTAISHLPERERLTIELITLAGLPLYRTANNPAQNAAARMRMSNGEMRLCLSKAYKHISEELEG